MRIGVKPTPQIEFYVRNGSIVVVGRSVDPPESWGTRTG